MRTDFLFYPVLQKQKTHTNLGMIWALSHRGDISISYEVEGAEERHQSNEVVLGVFASSF